MSSPTSVTGTVVEGNSLPRVTSTPESLRMARTQSPVTSAKAQSIRLPRECPDRLPSLLKR